MSRKSLCLLFPVLLLCVSLAQADPARLWAWNLGERAAEVALESSGAAGVRVEAGESVEALELQNVAAEVAISPDAEVLLMKVSGDFDLGAIEIDTTGKLRREKVGRKAVVRVSRPEWARDLLFMTSRITPGEKAEIPAEAGLDGRVRLAVGLEKDSAVTVTVRDERGATVRSFSASSTAPVRWRADLGSAAELTGARLVLRADRGAVVAGVRGKGGMQAITAAAIVGSGSFSQTINYSGSLTYTLTGGPPNTCGELSTFRNGSWLFAANYLCTDASGNATKGPWTWAGTASDQTDDPLYFRWPNGDTTNNSWHIWDKNPAVTYRDSAWGSPPTAYSGHATDTQWGAGFDFGGTCTSDFVDLTPNPDLWWDPATGTYSSTSYKYVTNTKTRVDRWYVQWSGSFPSSGSHASGHTYQWYTCCHDGNSGYCTNNSFTKP